MVVRQTWEVEPTALPLLRNTQYALRIAHSPWHTSCSRYPELLVRRRTIKDQEANHRPGEHTADCRIGDVELEPEACAFYRRSLSVISEAGVPFLVGGAYAFERYTG